MPLGLSYVGERSWGYSRCFEAASSTAAAAFWVLDALVSPEVRAARAALVVDRSNEELKKAAEHLGGKDTETYEERREIFRRFREQIVVEFPNDTDLAKGVIAGEPRRRPTEIMRHSGSHWGSSEEWEGTYDYLCATANHPSLAAFEFDRRRGRCAHLLSA